MMRSPVIRVVQLSESLEKKQIEEARILWKNGESSGNNLTSLLHNVVSPKIRVYKEKRNTNLDLSVRAKLVSVVSLFRTVFLQQWWQWWDG